MRQDENFALVFDDEESLERVMGSDMEEEESEEDE